MTRHAITLILAAGILVACGDDGDPEPEVSSNRNRVILVEARERSDELGMDPALTDRLERSINDMDLDFCDERAVELINLATAAADISNDTRDIVRADVARHVDEHC